MDIVPTAENFKVLPQEGNAKFSADMRPVDVMSGGARELMKGVGALGAYFEKQEEDDVIERSNRYLMDLSNLQDAYGQRQGEQALKDADGSDARENVFSAGREARASATEGMSARGRRLFERAVGAGERSFSHGVNQHHFRQDSIFADNQMTMRQTQQGQLIARNFMSGNQDVANATLDQLRDETYWYQRNRKGLSHEQALYSAAVNQSGLLTSIIEGMSKNGDQDGAVALMQKRVGDLNPAHYLRLQELLTANQAISDGRSAADMVVANNGKSVTVSAGGVFVGGNGKMPAVLKNAPRGLVSAAQVAAKELGIPPEFLMTQFLIETSDGRGGWSKRAQHNNFGAMKPLKGQKSYGSRTQEERGGRLVWENTQWASFDSPEEFAYAYADRIKRLWPGAVGAKDPQAYFSALQNGRGGMKYATASSYARDMSNKVSKFFGGSGGSIVQRQYKMPAADWLHMDADEIRVILEKAIPDNKVFRDTMYEGLARRAHITQRQEAEVLRAREDAAFLAISDGMSFSQMQQKGMLEGLKPKQVERLRKMADVNAPPDYGRLNTILGDFNELAKTPDSEIAALTKDNPGMRRMLNGYRQDMFSGKNFRYFATRKAVKEFLKVNMDIDPNSKKASEQEKLANLYVYMDKQIEAFHQQNKRYPNEDEVFSILGIANERVNRDSAFAGFMPSVPRYHPSANNQE